MTTKPTSPTAAVPVEPGITTACNRETAHCEDCGSDEITTDATGPVCAICGGRIVNPEDCDGLHG